MDEMMKGERGWRELQILRKEGGKTVWKREGHGPSNAARETDRDEGCITNVATESNDENWTEEEVWTLRACMRTCTIRDIHKAPILSIKQVA